MAESDDVVTAKMEQALHLMQERYAARLSGKIDEIRCCWDVYVRQGLRWEDCLAARSVLHRLSGSAGTFGLPQIGSIAGKIDAFMEDHFVKDASPDPRDVTMVSGWIDDLIRAAATFAK